MEYTREQALTIVTFLDGIGTGSFVEGFKDGLREHRDGLEGVASRTPVAAYRPIALSCYKAGVDAARKCLGAWLEAHADSQDDIANIRGFRETLGAYPGGEYIMG